MADLFTVTFTDNTSKAMARLDGIVSSRLDTVAKKLRARIRSKFLKSARSGHSQPGEYPRAINRHAANAIHVRRLEGRNIVQVTTSSPGAPQYAVRLRSLEDGAVISPKSAKFLAIPLSWAAKKHASEAKFRGQGGPRTFKPPGGGQLEFYKKKLRSGKYAIYMGTPKSSQSKSMAGGNYNDHYILRKTPVRRKPRKGVADAFFEEQSWIADQMTRSVQSEWR